MTGYGKITDSIINELRTALGENAVSLNAEKIAEYCDADSNSLSIQNLKQSIRNIDKAIENLWQSIERGENTEMITERINARTAEKERLLEELYKEESKCVSLTEEQIMAFLDYVLNLPNDDINKRRAIVNIFVNAIYLFDDHYTIIFNASERMMETENIPLDDIEAALNGCSDTLHECSIMNNDAPPTKNALLSTRTRGVFSFHQGKNAHICRAFITEINEWFMCKQLIDNNCF